jgi:hypothetical protein
MTGVEKVKTGLRQPYKIPPWVVKQSKRPLCWLHYAYRTAGLPEQRAVMDSLRAGSDWCLIVLDACRYDYLREWDTLFNGNLIPVKSAGHDTFEYVRLCWPDEYDYPYISGATPINGVKRDYDNEHFRRLYGGYVPMDHLEIIDVWEFGWDASLGTCPPQAVTDAALDHSRSENLVAHYFQPHAPYIGETKLLGHHDNEHARPHQGTPIDEPIWGAVKYGDVSDLELRSAYRNNLKVALKEVCRLIHKTDFDRYVIMGDHGEALGEWGRYSHPRVNHPHIRTAPWFEVSGLTQQGERFADQAGGRESGGDTDMNVEERLSALGYVE